MCAFRYLFVRVICSAACLAGAGDDSGRKLSDEERAVLEWTNRVRRDEKLPPLEPHPRLADAARSHAENMARKKELRHELDGKNVEKRVLDAGYDYAEVGENLAAGDGPLAEFFKMWLTSPVHRKNILADKYREIGTGLARDDKGRIYVTVVFGARRQKR